jgi:hypothetical protein
VFTFGDAVEFILAMHNDRSLCPGGLSKRNVAKLDVDKLQSPKEWGWRFLAFDFSMPNHQLVEVCAVFYRVLSMCLCTPYLHYSSMILKCYIVFAEMESAKKMDDPSAEVCSELSNHEVRHLITAAFIQPTSSEITTLL